MPSIRKPSSGASPDEYCRYVYDKYVRRKYVAKGADLDPLTAYKKGIAYSVQAHSIVDPCSIIPTPASNMKSITPIVSSVQTPKSEVVAVSKVENLLDDFLCEPQ